MLSGLLAIALRWYFVTHAQVLQPVDELRVTGDAVDYYRYAWNIVHHGMFASTPPGESPVIPNSFRDPGYPLLMAAWMCLFDTFDHWYAAMLMTQALLGGLTVTLLILAARRWLSPVALAVAGFMMAIWPHSIAIPGYLLSETLFGFLCAVAAWVSVEAYVRRRAAWFALSGLAWSVAALTNAILLPFALVLAGVLWLRGAADRRMALALALTSLILPVAWGARSLTIPPSTSSTGRAVMNLVQGSWPEYHDAYQRASRGDTAAAHDLDLMNGEMAALQGHTAKGLSRVGQRIGEAPLRYLGWYLSKPALLWSWDIRIGQGDVYVYPTRNSPLRSGGSLAFLEVLCYVLNPIVGLCAIAGATLALLRKPSGMLVLVLPALFATFVYGVLQSEPRYSVPFRGFEILLAAYALNALPVWLKTRKAV